MNHQNHIIQDPIYWDFKSIPVDQFRDRVRFFDEHAQELSQLEYHIWVDIKFWYIHALFEMGSYHKLLLLVDKLIEEIVIDNIDVQDVEDSFEELLYKKAASLYNTDQHYEATDILRQLIKINPQAEIYQQLYKKARYAIPNEKTLRIRSLSLLLLILVVPLLCIELVVINTLFPFYSDIFMWFRILLISGGLSIFLGLEYMRIRIVENEIKSLLK